MLSNQAENIAEFKSEGFRAEVVKEVLRYIYTGKVLKVENTIAIEDP